MTRKNRVKRGLQPHNPKETRIKTLVSYLGARIKECKRRPSISPCAYSAYDKDFDDEFEDNEFLILTGSETPAASCTSFSSTTTSAHTSPFPGQNLLSVFSSAKFACPS